MKKRSILKHMKRVKFEFSEYVDASFQTLCSRFVSLPVAIDIMMNFLSEGVKIIFRYSYAILKQQKQFVKSIQDPN
jgi:hypothetical protein